VSQTKLFKEHVIMEDSNENAAKEKIDDSSNHDKEYSADKEYSDDDKKKIGDDVEKNTTEEKKRAVLARQASSVRSSFHTCISKAPPDGKATFFNDEKGNLKFVNFVIRYPIPIFSFIIILCIASCFILGSLFDGNPISEGANEYAMNDIRSIAYDSLRLAQEEVLDEYEESQPDKDNRRLELSDSRIQEDQGDILIWIYDSKTSDGLFTTEGIKEIRKSEEIILKNPKYPNYCQLEYNSTSATGCKQPLSAMNIFYASEWNTTAADFVINQLESRENLPSTVNTTIDSLNNTALEVFNFLSICKLLDYLGDQCEDVKEVTSLIQWADLIETEIDNIIGKWDGLAEELNETNIEQMTEFIAYINQITTKRGNVVFYLDKNFALDNPKTMFSRSLLYWGELLNGTTTTDESKDELKKFILSDLLLELNEATEKDNNPEVQTYYFMGSLIFDIILRILAVDASLVLIPFLLVFFYLRYMIGSWFLACVGMFEIVMSLPLAWLTFSYIFQIKYFSALNILCIFIVMAIGADDIFVFMDSYKQSASAGPDVLSSFETRMSWVYRRSGSAMLLTSITTCCAFLVTISFPIVGIRSFGIFAAFVIIFDYFLVMSLFCTATIIYHNHFETKAGCCNCSCRKCDPTSTEIAKKKDEDGEEPTVDPISRFFEEKVTPFMLSGRNRIIIGVVLLIWVIISIIFVSRLQPTTNAEEFLDENHPLQIGATILDREFEKTEQDAPSKIYLTWGLEDANRKGVNQLFDPEFVGTPTFAENFVFSPTCQSAILQVCGDIENAKYENIDEYILKDTSGRPIVDCFVEELGAFHVAYQEDPNQFFTTCPSEPNTNVTWKSDPSWQINPADSDFNNTMNKFVNSCNGGPGNFGYKYDNVLGWDGTTVRYAGISVDSKQLSPRVVLSEDETRVIYDTFIDFSKEIDKKMEDACGTKTLMTDLDQKFIYMHNQNVYKTNAFKGCIIGAIFSFIVLFASTRKIHVSAFATIAILCVIASVVGTLTMLGFTLGTTEAILLSILAGFSVDYVIHLAHAYNHATGDVSERIKAAYGNMGISVFSGMLTSIIASIPLFFCTITFFEIFGTFLCLTIAFSWIFANLGFMLLIATFKVSMDKKWI